MKVPSLIDYLGYPSSGMDTFRQCNKEDAQDYPTYPYTTWMNNFMKLALASAGQKSVLARSKAFRTRSRRNAGSSIIHRIACAKAAWSLRSTTNPHWCLLKYQLKKESLGAWTRMGRLLAMYSPIFPGADVLMTSGIEELNAKGRKRISAWRCTSPICEKSM